SFLFFFFQAEDGIRDFHVTGVQTCALPILTDMVEIMGHALGQGDALTFGRADAEFHSLLIQIAGNRMLEHLSGIVSAALQVSGRSEERRVGKECRSRWSP